MSPTGSTRPRLSGTALLTGASGFIGRHLRDALMSDGAEVVAIRRPASPEAKRGRSVVADYEDLDSLTRIVVAERPRFIFHVAGATKGVTYGDFHRANVMPTQNLLSALAEAGHAPDRFVMVSSLASFGPSSLDQPHDETRARQPVEHYGRSKLEAEALLEAGDVPYTIIRPGGVYGPGDVDYFQLFKQVERGLNVFFGNRERAMSVVYVDDLIRAILDAAVTPEAARQGYFICDGEPVCWADFQRAIAEASGKKVRELDLPEALVTVAALGGELLSTVDRKPRLFNRQKAIMGKQEAWTCTHAAARRDFGYAPTVQLPEGIARTFAWYRDNGWV